MEAVPLRDVASGSGLQRAVWPMGDNRRMAGQDIRELARAAAKGAGFDAAGVAPVEPFPELDYFERWIKAGYAGEMEYLKAADERGELKRAALARVAPWARSVIVCALNYNVAAPMSTECKDRRRGWIS